MKLSELVEIAKNYNSVHIAGHEHPDGDCIGATLGLAMLLECCGVSARVLLKGTPEGYNNLPVDEWIDEEIPEEVELFISLDTGDAQRLGQFEECTSKAKEVINIDHHASNSHFGDINVVDEYASSTSEMIYHMVDIDGVMNKAIAEALYTGIIYDTGAFKHSNTKPSTHHAAADLIRFGIDFTSMINKMFFEKPYKSMKAQGLAYARLMMLEDEKVAVSYLNNEDFEALDITKAHTESIVQYMNEIKGVEAAVFFYALDDSTYKISLRSKGQVDVCAVAQKFGGGGHIKASGARFEGTIEDAVDAVVEAIALQL